MSDTPTHTAALRSLLVDQANASSGRRRPRWQLGALLVAVAVASGATGALTAGAIARTDAYEPNVIASLTLAIARANSVLVSEPFFVSSTGMATVNLGEAPATATGIAVRLYCTEVGSIDVALDDTWVSGMTCDSDSPTGGSGTVYDIPGVGTHTLTITSTTATGFDAFGAWVAEPPLPGPSSQQRAEMADGVATRDEYLAAFNRFAGCLSAGGVDIAPADPEAVILSYAIPSEAVDSGTDDFCYRTQFMDVDTAWQIQNEDQSETTLRMKECLSDRGLAPAERTADVIRQLEDAGIAIEECFA